jgi:hypothetical protein
LIGELQARGYSLAGIADLLHRSGEGRALADLLGADVQGDVELSPAELLEGFGPHAPSPQEIQHAAALGLIRVSGDRVVVSRAFRAAAYELAALGLPLDAVLDEYRALRAASDETAARFVALFEQTLWSEFAVAGYPPAEAERLVEVLATLTQVAQAVAAEVLRESIGKAAARFRDDQASAIAELFEVRLRQV